jgi:hypothetical protein
MTVKTNKVTRRDAIKLLGAAAGAAMLANAPTKWSKPSLMSGVLPAHAQTSCIALTFQVLEQNDGFLGIQVPNLEWAPQLGPADVVADDELSFSWFCQPGCFILGGWALPDGSSSTWRITTLAGQFDITWSDSFNAVSINLETGEYALWDDDAPAGCDWPILPGARPEDDGPVYRLR